MSIFSMQIILFFSVALGFGIFYFRYMITLDIDIFETKRVLSLSSN